MKPETPFADVEPETVIESEELYERYRCLVLSLARKYRRRAYGLITFEDLVQEGWLGVARGYRTFRTGHGASLNGHIGNHINWAISNSIVRVRGHVGSGRDRERSFTCSGIEDPAAQLVAQSPTGVRRREARAILHTLTKRGSRRAKCVAFLYYFRFGTFDAVAAKLGVSSTRVQQIVGAAFTGNKREGGLANRLRYAGRALELARLREAS